MVRLKIFADFERARRAIYDGLPDSGCTLDMSVATVRCPDGDTTIYRAVTDARCVDRLRGLYVDEIVYEDEVGVATRAEVESVVHVLPRGEVAHA